MQAVSSELEVLGRHDHPHLTVPFLKVLFYTYFHSVTFCYVRLKWDHFELMCQRLQLARIDTFSSNMSSPSLIPSHSWDYIFMEALILFVIDSKKLVCARTIISSTTTILNKSF
jgi:hypothetical protein